MKPLKWDRPTCVRTGRRREDAPSSSERAAVTFLKHSVMTRQDAAILFRANRHDASGRCRPLMGTPSRRVRTLPLSCGHTVRTRQDAPILFRSHSQDASGRTRPLAGTPSGRVRTLPSSCGRAVRTLPSSCGHAVRTRQDAPVTFRGCTEDG